MSALTDEQLWAVYFLAIPTICKTGALRAVADAAVVADRADRDETLDMVCQQTKELVAQNERDVPLYKATVTCPCGWVRALTKAYKCLYCDIFFCTQCAEQHFGKTIAEYRADRHLTASERPDEPAPKILEAAEEVQS